MTDDLLAKLGVNSLRNSKGSGKSAKDEIRRILGTYDDTGILPAYTIEQLSTMTKKSEVNIRTMLSDLRSTKYCGSQGVFLTERIRRPDGKFAFSYIPPAGYASAIFNHKDVPGLNHDLDHPGHDGRGKVVELVDQTKPAGMTKGQWNPLKKIPLLPAEMIKDIAKSSNTTKAQVRAAKKKRERFVERHKNDDIDESILHES